MTGIFISYRREDTRAYARTLTETLTARFGAEQIFRDIDSLAPGADFPEAIASAVGQCDVLLALIGNNWLSAERNGKRRLDDPNDYVRLEIVAALKRGTIVVPVLIEDAAMPARQDLPEELAELSDRHAVRLTDEAWSEGVSRLTQFLERVIPRTGRQPPSAPATFVRPMAGDYSSPSPPSSVLSGPPPVRPRKEKRKGILIGVLATFAALLLIGLLFPDESPPPEPPLSTTTLEKRLAGEITDVQLSQGRPCCTFAVQVRLIGFKDQESVLTTTVIDAATGEPGNPADTYLTPESDDDRASPEVPVTINRAGDFIIRFILKDPEGVELARRDVSQRVV